MNRLDVTFDQFDIDAIAADFSLRAPNKKALRALIMAMTEDDFDSSVTQVMNLATGVGKTYLMAALIEYLRRQDVENVLIVTPSLTVQTKTVQNFTAGHKRYIKGAVVPPEVATPQDYSAWRARQNGPATLQFGRAKAVMAFIFNIHQLIAPKSLEGATHGSTAKAAQLRTRKFDESAGALFEYLQSRDDLIVIADESHLYGPSAKAFSAALKELDPAATIGLTASASVGDHVVYKYPLYQAIADKFVKSPVLAFRKGGYGDDHASEEQQLRDALALRAIKQNHYDAYVQAHPGMARLNAVLFVVCADVSHATQVADLLRSPGYLGAESSVLQVDNEHNTEQTQFLLDRLDAPDSPVLAVVSVNKLKEGWDVKNIAVVVTLRAMASEVLTQQTMGRGLRLPFNEYTNVRQIDQLDIISHRSFQELLAAENVLTQFGLDEAVVPTHTGAVIEAVQRAGEQIEPSSGAIRTTDNGEDGPGTIDQRPGIVTVSVEDEGQPSLEITIIDDGTELVADKPLNLEPVLVAMNPEFAGLTFTFPVTMMKAVRPKFTLDRITPEKIQAAARRVSATGDLMVRKEIVASVQRKLRVADTEGAEVESIRVDTNEATTTLLRLLLDMQTIPGTPENTRLAERHVIPTFMGAVQLDHWTVKALASATLELENLIRAEVADLLRQTREVLEIHPKELPIETEFYLPVGENVHEQVDLVQHFRPRRWYDGWFKSLFEIESFDSWTAEYQLARLLNVSPNIVWWKRLHSNEGAFIQYNLRQRYFPDFVARDANGTYWIIEGKDARGRDNDEVQAKRQAAEQVVIKLLAHDEFEDQAWGYLIAYEDDVKQADSWDDLKTLANPVVTSQG